MKFYQQNYFKPYHQIVPQATHHHVSQQSPNRTTHHQQSRNSAKNFSRSPNIQHKSPYKHVKIDKPEEPIWQKLYQKGLKGQKDLLLKHENSKKKIDLQCTFKPEIKQKRRYLIRNQSSFLQRGNIWQENKIQKIMREKENNINRNLEECTFKPQLKEMRKASMISIGQGKNNHYYDQNQRKSHLKEANRNLNPYYQHKNSHNRIERQHSRSAFIHSPLKISQNPILKLSPSPSKQVNRYLVQVSNEKSQSSKKRVQLKQIKWIIKQQLKRLQM